MGIRQLVQWRFASKNREFFINSWPGNSVHIRLCDNIGGFPVELARVFSHPEIDRAVDGWMDYNIGKMIHEMESF